MLRRLWLRKQDLNLYTPGQSRPHYRCATPHCSTGVSRAWYHQQEQKNKH